MELPSSNIQKNSYFLSKVSFSYVFSKESFSLYFRKWNPVLSSPSSKNKKVHPEKNFLYFQKRKPRNFFYIFPKESFSYISGNRNPKNLLVFQEVTCKP